MVRQQLLARLDLRSALEAELRSTTQLLPSRADQQALVAHVDAAEGHLRAALLQSSNAKRASVVFASKKRGSRPLNLWRLQDRVFYRALTECLKAALPEHLRSRTLYADFAQAPMAKAENHFINVTDISSFYVYVDHDVLADELIAQTGDYEAVTALTGLLEQVMGGRVGLPQVHEASDTLGDTYIDPVRRRLIRAGYDAYSYSDDFRIGTTTLGQARSALELCASTARELGLVLNEAKTYTYSRERYQTTLDPQTEAEHRILQEEQLDEAARFLGSGGKYEDAHAAIVVTNSTPIDLADLAEAQTGFDTEDHEDSADSVTAEQAGLVRRVWEIWSNSTSENHRAPVVRQLLAHALPSLGAIGEVGPANSLDDLLRSAPDLTPPIAKYLVNLARESPFNTVLVQTQVESALNQDTLSEWQRIWLAHVAGNLGRLVGSTNITACLEYFVRSGSGPLVAYAAESLGRLQQGDALLLTQAVDAVSEEHRTSVLWALGQLDATQARNVASSALDRLLVPAEA